MATPSGTPSRRSTVRDETPLDYASVPAVHLLALNCPSCGAPLDPPPGESRFECPFCRRPFLVEGPLTLGDNSTVEVTTLDGQLYEAQGLAMAYYLAVVDLEVQIISVLRSGGKIGEPPAAQGYHGLKELERLRSNVATALDAVWIRRNELNAVLARASRGATPMQLPSFPSTSPESATVNDCSSALETVVDFLRGILSLRRSLALQRGPDARDLDAALQLCRNAAASLRDLADHLHVDRPQDTFSLRSFPLLDLSGSPKLRGVLLTPSPPGV